MEEIIHSDCRLFSGYSPCEHRRPCGGCPKYDPIDVRVLLIQLDALGDVLRGTSLLPAIRRRWPGVHITWLTRASSLPLLRNNPLLDRALPLDETTSALMRALWFDVALCPEKSVAAGALMAQVQAADKRGYSIDAGGAIVPLGDDADELYRLGLNNQAKFFDNRKSEQRLMAEALGLPWRRDRYTVVLDARELRWARDDRHVAGLADDELLIGWNTGCSPRYPYKRLDIADQVRLMSASWEAVRRKDRVRFMLLGGGPSDGERNRLISEDLREQRIPVHCSPAHLGLRRGLAATAACDMVVSGDSLGLHMAIGLKKPTVSWYGISCHQEIDLYGQGIKVLSRVPCRPCWLQSCDLERKCFRDLPWEEFSAAVAEMANVMSRDGRWMGEKIIGHFPPRDQLDPPLGISPGPMF